MTDRPRSADRRSGAIDLETGQTIIKAVLTVDGLSTIMLLFRVMVSGIVQKTVDQSHARIQDEAVRVLQEVAMNPGATEDLRKELAGAFALAGDESSARQILRDSFVRTTPKSPSYSIAGDAPRVAPSYDKGQPRFRACPDTDLGRRGPSARGYIFPRATQHHDICRCAVGRTRTT